jgi:hypothetical protein
MTGAAAVRATLTKACWHSKCKGRRTDVMNKERILNYLPVLGGQEKQMEQGMQVTARQLQDKYKKMLRNIKDNNFSMNIT